MSFTDRLKEFFHLSVPAVVDEEAKVIHVPAFAIPLHDELPPAPLKGVIEVAVEPVTKTAVLKVALKKKPAPKKKVAKKKTK